MTSTDKPVYQPGQVIRMRSLALRRPDLKPVAGQMMSFSLTDPRGNVVFREGSPTSRYGISSADCPMADELIEGNYQVDCRVGAATGRTTVEVRRYVLPRFKVALTLDRPYYQPGQPVKGRVQADYVFGKPVAEGSVTVTLKTADIATKALDGRASHRWQGDRGVRVALARDAHRPRARWTEWRVSVTATVRDPAGQAQERSEARVVSMHPIRIEVIPEAGALVKDLPNTIHLLTTTIDGQPVQARLILSGLDRELRTDELGVASFEFTPKSDAVDWTIRAEDDQGRTGRRPVRLASDELSGDYLVRTDKAVYDGGEPVHVLVLAGGVEPVFLDLVKDGQTVLSDSIPIAEGRGDRTIDLPPRALRHVVLHAYRYGPEGLPVQESRVIYVRPARTPLDPDDVRPARVSAGRACRADLRDDRRARQACAGGDQPGRRR